MGKLWENYFLQLTKKFLRGKKGNYFWKKTIFYWITFSNNQ